MIPAIKESMIVPANFRCKLGLPSGLTKIYFKIMKASGCSFLNIRRFPLPKFIKNDFELLLILTHQYSFFDLLRCTEALTKCFLLSLRDRARESMCIFLSSF